MLEYCWTKRRCHEEDEPPAEGWQYYGGCIKGSIEDPANLWTITRWAKEEGETIRQQIKGKSWALHLLGTYQQKELTARERALALLK